MNIGEKIREVMRLRGLTATELAREIPCERTNVYNVFGRKDISTKLLWRISEVLNYDFFDDLHKEFKELRKEGRRK